MKLCVLCTTSLTHDAALLETSLDLELERQRERKGAVNAASGSLLRGGCRRRVQPLRGAAAELPAAEACRTGKAAARRTHHVLTLCPAGSRPAQQGHVPPTEERGAAGGGREDEADAAETLGHPLATA